MRLILESDITHGPFPLRQSPNGKGQFKPVMAIIETGIVFSPEGRNRLAELYTQIPELSSCGTMRSLISMAAVRSTFSSLLFSIPWAMKTKRRWTGRDYPFNSISLLT